MKFEIEVPRQTVSCKQYFQTMLGTLNKKKETEEFVVMRPKYRQGECMDRRYHLKLKKERV